MRTRSILTRRLATVLGVTAAVSGSLVALPSTAAATWLQPRDLRVVAVTSTSFTVTVGELPTSATAFRLYASRNEPDVWWDSLVAGRHSSSLRSVTSSRPTITMGGLTYSSAPWYFRMEAFHGSDHTYSPHFQAVGLRPTTPSKVQTHTSSRGTYLTWGGVAATGFDVQQATNRSMTRGRHTFAIRSRHAAAHQFTPGSSAAYGHRYYWRVRAWNSGTASAWSSVVSARVARHLWSVRLMTYNLLNRELVGRMWPCGIRVAPWSGRKWQAVRVVQSYHPDILALQEAGERGGTSLTQGQDLVHGLGPSYRIADTDVGSRTVSWAGNYIAYKPSRFRAVGGGGHWNLPSKGARGVYDAVYQEFAARTNSRARFLLVNTHLPPYVGYGFDRLRFKETNYIIQHARALAARRGGIRVVYAGDFNSFPSPNWHPLDGPQLAMRNAYIPSDGTLALYRWNSAYASRNRYCIRPPTDGINLDYIWVSPGVVAGSWGIVLKLNSKHQYNLPIPSDHNPVAGTVRIPY